MTVNQLLTPWIEQVAGDAPQAMTAATRRQVMDAIAAEAAARAHRLPPGYRADDSRESIYRERDDSQR